MAEKRLEDKLKGHIHKPRPKQFFSIVTYQCGCGQYFTKEQYIEYCKKNQVKPILKLDDLEKSRKYPQTP